MKLYHGTSERYLDSILKNGILPRSMSKVEGNWDHSVTSDEDRVYLTKGYAPYFAFSTAEEGERWLIVEVNKDKLISIGRQSTIAMNNQLAMPKTGKVIPEFVWENLFPDEDFVEQALRGFTPEKLFEANPPMAEEMSLKGYPWDAPCFEKTGWIRDNIEVFANLAEASLNGLGNISWRGAIPPAAITRITLYDPLSNPTMSIGASDPTISTINWRICSDKYEEMTRWFLGYPNIRADRLLNYGGEVAGNPDEVNAEYGRRRARYNKLTQIKEMLDTADPEEYAQAVITDPQGVEDVWVDSDHSQHKTSYRAAPCEIESMLDGGHKVKDILARIGGIVGIMEHQYNLADKWEEEVMPKRDGIEVIETAQMGLGNPTDLEEKSDIFESILREAGIFRSGSQPVLGMNMWSELKENDPDEYKMMVDHFGGPEALSDHFAKIVLAELEATWKGERKNGKFFSKDGSF